MFCPDNPQFYIFEKSGSEYTLLGSIVFEEFCPTPRMFLCDVVFQ